jgi:type 1 fimbria pilin
MASIILRLINVFICSSRAIIFTITVLLLSGLPKYGHAAYSSSCVNSTDLFAVPGNITVNIDDPSDYPVGTLIAEPYVDAYEVIFTFTGKQCSVGSGTSTWAYFFDAPVATYSSPEGNLPVYSLVDGVGYAMSLADPNGPYQPLQQNPANPLWSTKGAVSQGALGLRYKLYLVTTGTLVPGRHFVTGGITLAKACLSSSMTSNTKDICMMITNKSFIINVKTGGCDIDAETPAIVNLERINASELTHKGDIGKNVDFAISLKCNNTVTVNITLTDPNGGDRENGVLYNDAGDGMAQNVGVQLLSVRDGGQTPQTVHLDESFTVGTATEDHYEIPMSARYFRTSDDTIVGGKVSASVIYELSYQ